MPPLDRNKEDQVWLAISETIGYLIAEGHVPAMHPRNCMGCMILQLNLEAQAAYLSRPRSITLDQLKGIFQQ